MTHTPRQLAQPNYQNLTDKLEACYNQSAYDLRLAFVTGQRNEVVRMCMADPRLLAATLRLMYEGNAMVEAQPDQAASLVQQIIKGAH